MKSTLGYFNAKGGGGENIFKLTIGNESLHQDSNDNGVKIINFATSKIWLLRAHFFHTNTFISTPEHLLIGRVTTRLFTY